MLSAAQVTAIVEADQARLGPLRFSPLRTWYTVLVQRLAGLEGRGALLERELDLEVRPDRQIDHLGDWAWLSQVVDGVREQLVDEERTSGEERPLSECWIGRGWLTASGIGPVGRRTMLLRFVNAADAADQVVIQETWWTGPGVGRSAVPVSAIVRTADPAALAKRVERLLTRRPDPSGATRWLLEELIRLAADDRGMGPTPERLGGLVHLSHGAIRAATHDQILFGRLPRRLPLAAMGRRRLRSRQVAVLGWRPGRPTNRLEPGNRRSVRRGAGPGEDRGR